MQACVLVFLAEQWNNLLLWAAAERLEPVILPLGD